MATELSWEESRDRLKKFRDENARRSFEVIDLWENSLSVFSYKLGSELPLILEQVCIAAFDCHRTDIAGSCIKRLEAEFPESKRVRRLRGQLLEVREKYEEAKELYDAMEKADPTDTVVRKRKVAIYKAQNNISGAIKELVNYLNTFMSDSEAWLELCDLYCYEQDFSKAAFCMEELILVNPHNHLFHQRYAEIRYAQGGQENWELARQYFAQTIKLNPNNIRALWGLFLVNTQLAVSTKQAQNRKEYIKEAQWAKEQIDEKNAREFVEGKDEDPPEDKQAALVSALECLQTNLSTN